MVKGKLIQYAENQHRLALTEMWKRCFPSDSDEFITFYFNQVYRPDETLVVSDEGIPAASLQMIPYRIQTGQTIHDAVYISGAMTHPAFRRRGYMEQLLLAAFDEMKNKGYALSFLIPQEEWLFEFYRKYDYHKAFPVDWQETTVFPLFSPEGAEVSSSERPAINIYTQLADVDEAVLYPAYSRLLSQKEHVVLKNPHQFSHILQDFFIDNGTLFANEQGIAFSFSKEGKIFLKEFFYAGAQSRNHFLTFISNHFSTNKLIVSIAGTTTSRSRFSGMIKVLDPTISLPDDIYMSMMLD